MATKGLMKLMLKIQFGRLSEFIEEKIKDADGSVFIWRCALLKRTKMAIYIKWRPWETVLAECEIVAGWGG